MGTVYLARRDDDEFDRQVAVKIADGRLSRAASRRFVRERQILARLEHENVARLYDGGSTEDGRPYLVLEYVDGVPITDHAATLPLSERLDLFLQVCAAVEFAHENLLIHCDIKPNNVLVDRTGVPKLLDFGIARLLASGPAAPHTPTTAFTPAYASPEQLEGRDLTTASDTFSLGVLLYELLSARHPFAGEGMAITEIQRSILRADPPAPSRVAAEQGLSSVARELTGDLDTIVATALALDPVRRYRSVAALAADIRAHRQFLPIAARSEGRWYRTGKFLRRHRAAAVTSVLGVLVVFAFSLALAAQWRRTRQERDLAARRTVEAEQQRDRAQRSLDILMTLFESALTQPESEDTIQAEELLRQGFLKVATGLSDLPDTQALVQERIASIYHARGQFEEALAVSDHVVAVLETAHGVEDPRTIQALGRLAEAQRVLGAHTQARDTMWRALESTDRRSSLELARHLDGLMGDVYAGMGLPHEALACYRLAIEGPGGTPPQAWLARTRSRLAGALSELGDFSTAEREFQRARQELPSEEREAWVELHQRHAASLIAAGRIEDAHRELEAASHLLQQMSRPSRPLVIETASQLGLCEARLGRFDEGERLLSGALALLRAPEHDMAISLGSVLTNLGTLAELQGQPETAAHRFTEAVVVLETALGPHHPGLAAPLLGRARATPDAERAEADARRALALLCRSHPSGRAVRQAEAILALTSTGRGRVARYSSLSMGS